MQKSLKVFLISSNYLIKTFTDPTSSCPDLPTPPTSRPASPPAVENKHCFKKFLDNFNFQYNLTGTNLNISLFKSGDFREDSGIYFSNGDFTGLLSVDANIDFLKLTEKVSHYIPDFVLTDKNIGEVLFGHKLKNKLNIKK